MRIKFPSELNRIRIINRQIAINKYFKKYQKRHLHLGSGVNVVEGWLNADKFKPQADIFLNAYKKFPFKDNSFDTIYSEHMFEHIHILKVPYFLKETLRILKPGGIFRMSVPDLELFAKKYVERDESFFKPYFEDATERLKKGQKKYWMVKTYGSVFMSMANKMFHHHRWMYDFETIEAMAKEIGYSKAIKQEFGKSISAEAAKLDQEKRKHETVYIDLIK